MKFMKIALSVAAIAAIATIYSTGAFVSHTHGIDNTVAGFLTISNAEMAQQIGGEPDPSEGWPFFMQEVPRRGNFCKARADCRHRKAKLKQKKIENAYWRCEPCTPYININFFNLIELNIRAPKYSRLDENGNDYKPSAVQLLLVCEINEEDKKKNCIIKEHKRGGTHGNCLRPIGFCDED